MPRNRIDALDVCRGFGILIILLSHIIIYGTQGEYSTFTESGKVLFAVKQVLVDGASRFIFCIVFGVGILLSALNRSSSRTVYLRAAALIGVGAVNILVFQWPGDFLVVFGFASVLSYYCCRFSPLRLAVVALTVSVVFFGIYNWVLNPTHNAWVDAQAGDTAAWVEYNQQASNSAAESRSLKTSYRGGFEATTGAMSMVAAGWVFHDVAEAFVLILVGMALFKSGFFEIQGRQLRLTILLCMGFGILLNVWLVRWQMQHSFDIYVRSGTMFPIYRVANLFMAIGWISLFMWLVEQNRFVRIRRYVSNVGKMALSNYLGQSVVLVVIFHVLGQFAKHGVVELYVFCVGVWIVQIVLSGVWMKYQKFGPIEIVIKEFIRRGEQSNLLRVNGTVGK